MSPRRRRIGIGVGCAAALWGAAAVLTRCSGSRDLAPAVIAAMPTLIELLTATIGIQLMLRSWPGRAGHGLHCKVCGYYQEPRGRLAPACPECAARWLWIGNTKRGRRTGAMPGVLAGAALCVLALTGGFVHLVTPWAYLRFLPTPVLLSQAAVLPDDSTGDLWSEITGRSLPPSMLDALAEPLLSKKARDGYLSRPSESVLFDAMTRPGAPAASSARYFASFLSAMVDTPERATEDEPFVSRGRAKFHGHTFTLGPAPRVIVLSALFAQDDPEPVNVWSWDVNPESNAAQEREMDATIPGAAPGNLRLRQVFWLAVGLTNSEKITWRSGQPVLPSVMSIRDQFEEVREVVVTPKMASVPTR